ncbi:type II and III secretion system protein [Fluviicola sp.]|uniref:type II secretion system protein GspD n=1 Tax=Fluviicola sp. TaxID=1917219 RepID=UPI002601C57D|nr:type II and III secretion system protein [Fluviicola sp.]
MKKHLLILFLFGAVMLHHQVKAQSFTEPTLRAKLDSLSIQSKGLNNTFQLNVSGLPLSELVNSIALENNLNISIDPVLNNAVSYNFFDAKVKDVLVFLYEHFDIEYRFVGNILAITKREIKKEAPQPKIEKKIDVKYNPSNEFLSVDLKNDSLFRVMKEISSLSGKNIVIAPDVRDKPITGYFLNRPFDQVVAMTAKANGLESSVDENGITYVFASTKTEKNTNPSSSGGGFKPATDFEQTGVQIKKNEFGTLDIIANNADISDIIKFSAQELLTPYFFYNKPDGKASFQLQDVTFPEVLNLLFVGTKYAYKEDNKLFLIGENKSEGIRVTEVVRMENRTIENVKTSVPKELTQDLDVNEFPELNALIVTGPARKVAELKSFLSSIDIVVPLVQIDVMILISERTSTVTSGVKMGLGDKPTVTSGTVFPSLDVNLGASALNNILNTINGFGVVNLGAVTENFYMSLQLLESNGMIDVESTPKITTLSSHLATVSIGQTTYYQEQQVNYQNTVVNQGVLTSKIWKSVDANLTVKIKPFVSSDGNVTMEITLTNDDFDGSRVDLTAPPNATKQTFESMIRVQNGDVVLLGGLDKKQNNNSGNGVPLLSRVPVIKWLFSSRSKAKRKYKLHIIVRPTVTY